MDEVARLRKRRRVCSGGRGVGDVGPTGEECITDCRPAAAVGKAIKQASKQAGGTAGVTFNAWQVWGQRAKVKAKMEGDGRNGRKAGMRARKLKRRRRAGSVQGERAGAALPFRLPSRVAYSRRDPIPCRRLACLCCRTPPQAASERCVRSCTRRCHPLAPAEHGRRGRAAMALGQRLSASAPAKQRNSGGLRGGGLWGACDRGRAGSGRPSQPPTHTSPLRDSEGYR